MKTSPQPNHSAFRLAAFGLILVMLAAPLAPVFAGSTNAPLALGTIEVTTLSDDPGDDCVGGNDCSLRGAITLANGSTSSDDIVFNHAAIQGEIGNAAPELDLLVGNGELPLIVYPVNMNLRYTNPVSSTSYDLVIDGSAIADDGGNSYDDSGFRLADTASDSEIRNVNLVTFPDYGVYNMADGLVLDNVNVTTTANESGIYSIAADDIEVKNLKVTDAANHGVHLNNVGLNSFGANLISNVVSTANGGAGVSLNNGTTGVTIQNSFLGVNANGTTAAGNGTWGVIISDSYGNVVQSSVISANTSGGVTLTDPDPGDNSVSANRVLGNKIGVTGAGTGGGVGNGGPGVNINGVPVVEVTSGNVISANSGNGVRVNGANASSVLVDGNYVGVDGTGELDLGNGGVGIAIIDATGTTVSSNLISGNSSHGVSATGTATDLTITANTIGLDKDRIDTIDNDGHGVVLIDTTASLVNSNTISGNDSAGVRLAGAASDMMISNNRIGTNVNGVQRANGTFGVQIVGTSSIITVQNNNIQKNADDGINVAAGLTRIYLLNNNQTQNGGLGIDLAGNGVTGNDSPDVDGVQNFPVLSNAVLDSTTDEFEIQVNFLSLVGVDFALDFYVNDQCDPLNYGEGLTLFNREDITTGDGASATPGGYSDVLIITGAASLGIADGKYITAVATRDLGSGDFGNTSEYSNCVRVVDDPSPGASNNFVVNSLDDDSDDNLGDGICETTTNNECTLRAAVEQANAMDTTSGPISITFSLSGTYSAPFVISIGSTLTIDNWMLINAGSETSGQGTPYVVLNGSDSIGMNVTANGAGSEISHLVFYDFSTAIRLVSTDTVVIKENYIGLDYDGLDAPDGNQIGVAVNNSSDNTIRNNVISGNDFDGVQLNGAGSTGNLISDNLIGPSANGNVSLGSGQGGVLIDAASSNFIDDNIIAGNGSYGIGIDGGASSSGNTISDNKIGVSGNVALGNGNSGVYIDSGINTQITGNTIRNNSGAEVAVVAGTGNKISQNAITAGGGMGIDLGNNGVTANDVGDPDSGPNNLQNFPVLTAASSGSGSTWIEGTFNSLANTGFSIELYANDIYLTTLALTTDGSGNSTLGYLHGSELATLTQIKALAIRTSNGDTSEFSTIVYVVPGTVPTLTPTVTSTFTATATQTLTPSATNTGTLTATNTGGPANTNTPTRTPTTGGGGVINTNTATNAVNTSTPNATTTSISASLTALAATDTATSTSVPGSPSPSATFNFFVPSDTPVPTATFTETPGEGVGGGALEEELIDIPDDSGGGGGDEFVQLTASPTYVNAQGTPLTAAQAALTITAEAQNGLVGDLPLGLILMVCGGLGFLILIIGGGLELYRWLNSRRN